MSEQPTSPVLKVVRGNPTDEELAAVVTVLVAGSRSATPPAKKAPSAWATYWNSRRTPPAPGAGGWRASTLPR